MTPFYIIFFIIVVCSFCEIFNVKKEQKLFLYGFLLLMMASFAGFRFGDQDYFNYSDIFANPSDSPDLGFGLLAQAVRIFTSNTIVFFFIIALFSVSLNFLSFKRFTPFMFFAVLFYFIH